MEAETQDKKNPKGAGRKAGVRSEKYNLALQDFLMGKGSVAEIAKKYGIDRSGLNKVINSTNREAEQQLGVSDLKAVAVESKEAVIGGLENIQALKNSTNPTHQALADNLLTTIQETSLSLARNIQIIGGGLLKDLHNEIAELRGQGKMKLETIGKALTNLEIANRIVGIPKAPQTQINIQNNNANIQSTGENTNQNRGLNIKVLVMEKPKDQIMKENEKDVIDAVVD